MTHLQGDSGLQLELDERSPDLLVVKVSGELGAHEAADFESLLTPASARDGVVALDLADVPMISSLALGVLVSLQRGIKVHGGRFRIARPHPRVLDALHRVRLDAVIPIYDSVDAAIAR